MADFHEIIAEEIIDAICTGGLVNVDWEEYEAESLGPHDPVLFVWSANSISQIASLLRDRFKPRTMQTILTSGDCLEC